MSIAPTSSASNGDRYSQLSSVPERYSRLTVTVPSLSPRANAVVTAATQYQPQPAIERGKVYFLLDSPVGGSSGSDRD